MIDIRPIAALPNSCAAGRQLLFVRFIDFFQRRGTSENRRSNHLGIWWIQSSARKPQAVHVPTRFLYSQLHLDRQEVIFKDTRQ
jgi:hypothetical protein